MHRLTTTTAIIVCTALITICADARPVETRELVIKSPATAARSRPDLSRMNTIQWQPGLVSTNVRIRPRGLTPRAGEKGGTEDINIGVGELQECTISKSMDAASPLLARLAKSRRPLPQIVLRGRGPRGSALIIKMKHVYISSYRTGASSSARSETVVIRYTGLE